MKLNKFDEIWNSDFSSLLAKKKQQSCKCAAPFLYISLTLFCTTTMWNFLAHFMLENVCAHRCLSCSCSLFFLHCRSFSPCWPPFLIFWPPFPCFSSKEICNALAMLSMSLKTLKFSRTRLCCLFFSLLWLSPDRLSLSKKSGWTLSFPPKNPVLYLPYLLIELFYIGMPVVRKGVRTLTWLLMPSEPKFLPMVHCCVRESFAKNVCGEPRRPKR